MKRAYLVGVILVVAFAALGATQFRNTVRTYVSFTEARSAGRPVQIKGAVDKASVHVDKAHSNLNFNLTDPKGDRMTVVYRGTVPGNFGQASHVVAIGQYRESIFQASRLLVKCPSKYQGQESGS